MQVTATQAPGFMIQRYDLEGAVSILQQEGLVLLPTDALWCVACDALDPVALERLRRLRPPTAQQPFEILFPDLQMLKAYSDHLHPRLETLLAFHHRPLTIMTPGNRRLRTPAVLPDGQMAARIVRDNYCRHLTQMLDSPIATIPAHFPDSPLPAHFGRIRSDIIERVDYVAKYRPKEIHATLPSVMVQVDEFDELVFLRE